MQRNSPFAILKSWLKKLTSTSPTFSQTFSKSGQPFQPPKNASVYLYLGAHISHKSIAPRYFPSSLTRQDALKRQAVAANEISRRAYLYIARNTTLPGIVRAQAMLKLNSFPIAARPVAVNNRCKETGRGRGVFGHLGLCRYQLKMQVAKGAVPGWEKASW
ncbi:hypothetical protein BT69DRAFT_1367113 [Atractiella rhizophila]|nr:hypothetical protein BT69DRAFT_1367113 [Atractiella rhizophila]